MNSWYRSVYLKSEDWKSLRQNMLHVNRYTCEGCGSKSNLQVHHIQYRNLVNVKPEDLVVLCPGCHYMAHQVIEDFKIIPKAGLHGRTLLAKAGVIKIATPAWMLRSRCIRGIEKLEDFIGRAKRIGGCSREILDGIPGVFKNVIKQLKARKVLLDNP